ncbi:MAG: DNA repair protein RecN [Bacteriovoracaceae bacterium]
MHANFYLKSLVIQNFATFKNQTVKFRPGFNAIVGETGSGKSLLLDALQLILGGRADKKVVRRETEYSLVEAIFHCEDPDVRDFLHHEGYPVEGKELIIKRLVYKNGSHKTYVNHLSCTLNFLAQFSRKYIDLVGQFENQKLLSGAYQLHLLDHFAKLRPEVDEYQKLLREYRTARKRQEELEASKREREQRLDYLNYQLQEIEKLNPSSQDELDLLKKKNTLVNLEKTQRLGHQVRDLFDGAEGSVGMMGLFRQLNTLVAKNTDVCGHHHEELSLLQDQLVDLQAKLEKHLNQDVDPEELEGVIDRLDLYQKLKKKFGGSAESIIQSQVEFLKEKNHLEELEINLGESESHLSNLEKELRERAGKLHEKRIRASKKLSQELTSRVRLLNMLGATITISLEKSDELLDTGITLAHFMAETNAGEGQFRIKDIASGGELSRILLSVRQILSSYDSISIFLFDEIDTGIGGETANCIGKALTEVGANGQVIAITHLPQIAQYSELLIVVQKEIQTEKEEKRTESSVKELFGKMIMKEVKAMAQLS